jgi:4-amino-4-deoxy-L-arabinose transferase-like glycosyltransferase
MRRFITSGPALWALLTLALLLGAAPILTYPLGRDQGEFAIIGTSILRGAVPYVDIWNPKPPAIFYVYAGLIRAFGQEVWAIRTLDLFLLPIMTAALVDIGRRLGGLALGLWAALLWGVFYFTETFWTLSQNDGVASVVMTLAVWSVFALLDSDRRALRLVLAMTCGALCAAALWFKYPYVVFVVVLALTYLITRRAWDWGEVGAFTAGGLLVGVGGMGWLATMGALSAWWESATVTAGYTAQGYDWATFRADMANYIGFRWRHWHVLWVLAAAGLGLLGYLHRPMTMQKPGNNRKHLVTDSPGWIMIVGWLFSTAIAMLIQAKGYDYHWLPMLPALALLASCTVNQVFASIRSSERLPRWTAFAIVIPLALIALSYLFGRTWGTALPYLTQRQPPQIYYEQFVGGEFVASDSAELAAYLEARLPRESSLFVWGFRPELYYLTHTRPATRFIFQFPLVADWYPAAWQQETVDALWAAPPPYVVVARGDFMPWVTGRDADSNMLLQEYTELNNWLIFNYEQDATVGSFLVWRLKETPG